MGELEYWKLKSKMIEIEMEKVQLQSMLRDTEYRRITLMKENNLDINKNYRFNDETFELVDING